MRRFEAIFTFADYIKVKDPKGSDEMMVSLVTNPEYKDSRRAYRGLSVFASERQEPSSGSDQGVS